MEIQITINLRLGNASNASAKAMKTRNHQNLLFTDIYNKPIRGNILAKSKVEEEIARWVILQKDHDPELLAYKKPLLHIQIY